MRLLPVLLLFACSDAGLTKFDAPPVATMTAPDEGASVREGATVTLRGSAADADDASETLTASWYAGTRALCSAAPEADGTTTCDATLAAGDDTVSLEVRDPNGATGEDARTLVVVSDAAPTAVVVAPDGLTPLYSDRLVELSGIVSDAENPPDALTVTWTSSVDGALATTPPDASGNAVGAVYLSEGDHLVTLAATDPEGNVGQDAVVVTVHGPNTPPACTIAAPADGTVAVLGSAVTFEGLVADAEVSPDQLGVTWESDRDGLLGSSTPDSGGDVALVTTSLSAGPHTVTLRATDDLGATCSAFVLLSVGTPPSVAIGSPGDGTVVNEGDAAVFAGTATDAESAATALVVAWTSDVSGTLDTTAPDAAGALGFLATLPRGAQTVTLTATDPDGMSASASVRVTVNGLPSAPGVSIAPPSPATADDLVVSVTTPSTDPEGDAVSYRYAWYRDGILAGSAATVPAADTAKGQTWDVILTPSDPWGDGAAGTARVTVGNTAPEVGPVTISPPSPGTADTLTASTTPSDADGDAVSVSWAWTVDGVPAGSGASLAGTAFARGDLVEATATPSDGTSTGASASASVTIGDTAPTSPVVTIDPASPVEGRDDLVCVASSTDADGDALVWTWAWTVDGAAAGATDTVAAADTTAGETWTCTARVSDGTASASASAAVVIGNGPADWPATGDLDDGLVITGVSTGTYGASPAVVVDDIDGDGLPELLLGGEADDSAYTNGGRAEVFFGASLPATGTLDLDDADVHFRASAAGEYVGIDLAALGDVDADGLGDLALVSNSLGGASYGDVSIFRGADLATGTVDLGASWATVAGTYESSTVRLVEGTGTFGDIDGDGLDDVWVGEPQTDVGRGQDNGAFQIYLGSTLATGGAFGLRDADLTLQGDASWSFFGKVGGTAVDVDGDGLDDLLPSRWDCYTYGCAGYVVYASTLLAAGTLSAADADITITPVSDGSDGGVPLLPGDLDGDGRTDLVTADARAGSSSGDDMGAVYVLLADLLVPGTVSLADASYTIPGGAYDYVTRGAPFPDYDGDGADDLLLVQASRDRGAGAVDVFSSADLAPGDNALSLAASVWSAPSGVALPSSPAQTIQWRNLVVADFDGDGNADFGVSQSSYDSSRGALWVEFAP